jgi:hypothetical protein
LSICKWSSKKTPTTIQPYFPLLFFFPPFST